VRSPTQRARRLVRWYPQRWRARYGEEFTQLLIDDMAERPRSLHRTADVVRSGLAARLRAGGLAADDLAGAHRIRSGLAWLGAACAAFLAFGVAEWAQITVGWQWSAPSDRATTAAMLLMSGAALAFVALGLLAAIPLGWAAARALRGGSAGRIAGPLLFTAAAAVVVVWGSLHFGHHWPGTGGHEWPQRGLVPGAVARFCWAATLWVSAYWAHPHSLLTFPATELAWMAISPLALAAMLAGGVRAACTLSAWLTPGALRFQIWLAAAATVVMAVFLAGAGGWVLSGGPGAHDLFGPGAIDVVGLAVMAAAFLVAAGALERTVRMWISPSGAR
jgi:hypothetical protein